MNTTISATPLEPSPTNQKTNKRHPQKDNPKENPCSTSSSPPPSHTRPKNTNKTIERHTLTARTLTLYTEHALPTNALALYAEHTLTTDALAPYVEHTLTTDALALYAEHTLTTDALALYVEQTLTTDARALYDEHTLTTDALALYAKHALTTDAPALYDDHEHTLTTTARVLLLTRDTLRHEKHRMGKKRQRRRAPSSALRDAGQSTRTADFLALIRRNGNSMVCTSRSHQTPDCIVSIDPRPDQHGRTRTSHTHDVRAAAAENERRRHQAFNVRPRGASPAPALPRQQHTQITAMEGPALEAIVRAAYQAGAAAAAAATCGNLGRPSGAEADKRAPGQGKATHAWAVGPDHAPRPSDHSRPREDMKHPATIKRKASSVSEGEPAAKRKTKGDGQTSETFAKQSIRGNGDSRQTQEQRDRSEQRRPEGRGDSRGPHRQGIRRDAGARNYRHAGDHRNSTSPRRVGAEQRPSYRHDGPGQRPRDHRGAAEQHRDAAKQRQGTRRFEQRRPEDHSNPGNRTSTRRGIDADGQQHPRSRHDSTEQRLGNPLLEQRQRRKRSRSGSHPHMHNRSSSRDAARGHSGPARQHRAQGRQEPMIDQPRSGPKRPCDPTRKRGETRRPSSLGSRRGQDTSQPKDRSTPRSPERKRSRTPTRMGGGAVRGGPGPPKVQQPASPGATATAPAAHTLADKAAQSASDGEGDDDNPRGRHRDGSASPTVSAQGSPAASASGSPAASAPASPTPFAPAGPSPAAPASPAPAAPASPAPAAPASPAATAPANLAAAGPSQRSPLLPPQRVPRPSPRRIPLPPPRPRQAPPPPPRRGPLPPPRLAASHQRARRCPLRRQRPRRRARPSRQLHHRCYR